MEEIANAYGSTNLYPLPIRCIINESIVEEQLAEDINRNMAFHEASGTNQTHPTKLQLNILTPPSECLKPKAMARLMQTKWSLATTIPSNIRIHVDGGANRSITNDRSQLIKYRNIKKYPMSGVAAGEPALICTGLGYLPWQSDQGEIILVKCYYSEHAAETIVSPNDIVINHIQDFDSWGQHSNIDTGTGRLEFHRRSASPSLTYSLSSQNGLWYYTNKNNQDDFPTWTAR